MTYIDILNQFNGLKKTQLEPKFEVCNSKNTDFGIMVLGFDLKYAIFDFQMSIQVKSDSPIFKGCSQNFMH